MKSTMNITIRGYHIDHFGHVNHGRYVELLEEARWCYLEENRLIDVIHKAGASHVVSRIEIDYRHPARVTDSLCFETQVAGRTDHGFWMDQDVSHNISGKSVLHARVFNVFVDHRGKPKTINDQILDIWSDLAVAEKIRAAAVSPR